MAPLVLIETDDSIFAEHIGRTISQWGIRHLLLGSDPEIELQSGEGDVALLDIRELGDDTFAQVGALREKYPGVEVVLINRPENVVASIAGMKAGAVDEIIVPVDTGALRTIVTEVCERRLIARQQKNKKPLLTRFSEAMMAATFAQAGDFEGALDLLGSPGAQRNKKVATKKNDDSGS